MSKRKKVQISEEKKRLNISKGKRSVRRKTQQTGDNYLEKPVQTFHSSHSPSKATVAGAIEECKRKHLEETEMLEADLDESNAAEGGKVSSETQELHHTKVFLPASQGGKLVPVFTKRKKPLTERPGKDCGETTKACMDQDMLESCKPHGMARNVGDTAERAAQNPIVPSESLESIDFSVTNVEDAGDQIIFHCKELNEKVEVQMQEQDRNRGINSDDDVHGGRGIAPHLQANICEKEMPEKQVSFVLQTSNNDDAEGLKERELSTESLKCPLVKEMLAEDWIIEHLKNNKSEEEHPSSLEMVVEQNKAIQDIIKPDDVKEANWTKNGSRKDTSLVRSTASQSQMENSITQLPLRTDITVLTLKEQSSSPYTSCVSGEGISDGKRADQSHLHKSRKTEKQNDVQSSTEISGPGAAQCTSTVHKKATECSLWTSDKPVKHNGGGKTAEQSSPCRRKTSGAEQASEEGQDIFEKRFPDAQSECLDFEKAEDIREPKCERVIETSCLFFPQPNEILNSENRKASVCSQEKERGKNEAGMEVEPDKGTTPTPAPYEEVPILFHSQQQWKENRCDNLASNIKQPEFDGCGPRPNEISDTFSNTLIAQQYLTQMHKTETKPKPENSPSSTEVHRGGKEMVKCERNKSEPVHVGNCLSSVKLLSQMDREVVVEDPDREINVDAEAPGSLLPSNTCPSINVSNSRGTVAPKCSFWRAPLDLEFLPNSQLQGTFESNTLEFLPPKPFSLDYHHIPSKGKSDPCVAKDESRTEPPTSVVPIGLDHSNNSRVEMIEERICDPSKQEDATDVVCGLIKELSNLNRFIMSKHRDLDSFKRLRFRRNKQSGKFLHHNLNNMTSTIKKKKEM